MCVYALNSNCFLYQPIRWQYLSPWQLISKSAFSFQAACFSAVCLCVPLWTCAAVMPHNFAQYATADRWPDHVCVCVWVCVCLAVLLLAGNGKCCFFFPPVTVHADRGEKCELWFLAFCNCSRFWIHFRLFGGEISSMPGKTSSGDAGKRVLTPCQRGSDPAEHAGSND